ncbi:MAG: hypothetical protein RL166_242 [Actinomycetota bacterium]|jgi:MFS family permease
MNSGTQWKKIHFIALARALSLLGTELTLFTLVFREKDFGPASVAAIFIVGAVPAIALSPLTGWMADRFSTKSIIPAFALVGASAVALQFQRMDSWIVLTLLAVSTSCGLAVANAWGKVIRDLASESDYGQAFGVVQTYFGLAMLAGPFLAGILVSQTGYGLTFVIDALLTGFVALVPFIARVNFVPEKAGGPEKLKIAGGFQLLFTDRFLRSITTLVFAMLFCVGVVNVGDVFLLTDQLKADALIYGLVGGGFALGTVLASVVVAKLKFSEKVQYSLLGCGFGTISIAGVLVGLAPNYWFVLGVWFFAGLGNAMVNSYGVGIMTKRIPMQLQGRTFAAFSGVTSVAAISSHAIAGFALEVIDVRTLFISAGILAMLCFALLFPNLIKAGMGS